jgi:hypothetical protein
LFACARPRWHLRRNSTNRQVDSTVLVQALLDCGVGGGRRGTRMILEDMRGWYDPESHASYKRHTGLHASVLKLFVHGGGFAQWLRGVRARLLESWEVTPPRATGGAAPSQPEVTCVFYCKAGKHRSVVARRVLEDCILADERFELRRCIDCTDWTTRGCCGACSQCMADPHGHRETALRLAVDIWLDRGGGWLAP